MSNLKQLRGKIQGVRSTRRITAAMKMVAAAKFRKARMRLEQARPYGEEIRLTLARVVDNVAIQDLPPIWAGIGNEENDVSALYVVLSSDRGMCGAMNNNVFREVRQRVEERKKRSVSSVILPVGRKADGAFARYKDATILPCIPTIGQHAPLIENAMKIWHVAKGQVLSQNVQQVFVVYPHFVSAISQGSRLLSLMSRANFASGANQKETAVQESTVQAGLEDHRPYEIEPSAAELLPDMIDEVQHFSIFLAMLETSASEQGARMTSMDNATRNATDMLEVLTRNYNRSRQADITKELSEIVSGAAAIESG